MPNGVKCQKKITKLLFFFCFIGAKSVLINTVIKNDFLLHKQNNDASFIRIYDKI